MTEKSLESLNKISPFGRNDISVTFASMHYQQVTQTKHWNIRANIQKTGKKKYWKLLLQILIIASNWQMPLKMQPKNQKPIK
ncbi:MAG TPA: hypothetical protein DCR81_06785 [Smithella sp.]|nr:hypothetical protein [Smithella sp.]